MLQDGHSAKIYYFKKWMMSQRWKDKRMKTEMPLMSETGGIFFSVVSRRKLRLKEFGFLNEHLLCAYNYSFIPYESHVKWVCIAILQISKPRCRTLSAGFGTELGYEGVGRDSRKQSQLVPLNY